MYSETGSESSKSSGWIIVIIYHYFSCCFPELNTENNDRRVLFTRNRNLVGEIDLNSPSTKFPFIPFRNVCNFEFKSDFPVGFSRLWMSNLHSVACKCTTLYHSQMMTQWMKVRRKKINCDAPTTLPKEYTIAFHLALHVVVPLASKANVDIDVSSLKKIVVSFIWLFVNWHRTVDTGTADATSKQLNESKCFEICEESLQFV